MATLNGKGFGKIIEKLFLALPLKKLSSNQAFDLAFGLLMPLLVIIASCLNFGPWNGPRKAILVFACLFLMAWSLMSNA